MRSASRAYGQTPGYAPQRGQRCPGTQVRGQPCGTCTPIRETLAALWREAFRGVMGSVAAPSRYERLTVGGFERPARQIGVVEPYRHQSGLEMPATRTARRPSPISTTSLGASPDNTMPEMPAPIAATAVQASAARPGSHM